MRRSSFFDVRPRTTSLSLLSRMRTAENSAWERFIDLYGPVLYDYCRRRGLDCGTSQDLVQEITLAVLQSIGRFRKDHPRRTFRGWLYRIAVSKIVDHHRRTSGQPRAIGGTSHQLRLLGQAVEQVEDIDGDIVPPVYLELYRAMMLIRGDVCEQTWRAFWGTTIEERSAAELAGELQISEKAVRQAKYRVLKRLRDEFGELLSSCSH